jgi:REP element-mobilizing transposase RayT
MENAFWLVTTAHLTDRIWFKDEEDFKVGMNHVAVHAARSDVRILAFILMSNHVHFVLSGTREEAGRFIQAFKKSFSLYHARKYHSEGLLLRNEVDIREIDGENESLERSIAYVHMNSVAANICLHASAYPWGTGETFFNPAPSPGERVGKRSGRALVRLLHSKATLPESFLLDGRGFVLPASYVPVQFVEKLFRTPRRMSFFLQNSSKARLLREAPSFDDQLILQAMNNLCISLFRNKGLNGLNETQTAELLKQLRYRFSSDPNQLARVAGLPYETVCALLETP